MKIGVYGDVHLTRNMRSLQAPWDISAMQSITNMYDKFDEMEVESAVCLGDFFDAPRIEARSMSLVMPVLDHINSRTYPTYFLLGNHEADSAESNILDILVAYENIIPVTHTMDIEGMMFIPYYDDPQLYDLSTSKVVFTHHDIYGSELASGKTKAFFGIPPAIFSKAKLVMNGHVHLKSKPAPNILNAGSLLVSQQGELKLGDYPSYYLLDTHTGVYSSFDNKYSMVYLSVDVNDIGKLGNYSKDKLVLRVSYEGEIPDLSIESAHLSWRKKLTTIGSLEDRVVRTSNFDMKNYLAEYIKKDEELSDDVRDEYIKTGVELLS